MGSVFIQFGNAIFGFVLSIVLARNLGAYEYGNYTYVFALISVLAIPIQLGLPNLLVRFIAQYQSKGEFGKIKGILKWSNLIVATLSLLLIVAVFLIMNYKKTISVERMATLRWGLLLIPVLALGALRGASLRGLRYVVLGKLPDMILRQLFFLIFVVLFCSFISVEFESKQAMMLHLISAFLAFIVGSFFLFKKIPRETIKARSEYETRRWISVAIPFLLTGGMLVLNNRLSILMLGWMTTPEDVGIYEIAVKGSTLVAFSLLAANAVLGPYFSKFYTENKMKKIQHIARLGILGSMIVALPIVFILIIFGEQILLHFYGKDFLMGYNSLKLLTIGQMINVAAGSVGLLLNMTKYEKLVFKGLTLSTIVNIIFNLVLIPVYGINGAAISTIISFLIWNILLVRWSIIHLDVDPSVFSLLYYFKKIRF
ncbi:MAG: oligosaccharide flippase family protein [Bacteroidetes bacterium]|nr:oligosaccharide flippase family protein [Bacteroidota bacterium]